MTRIWATILLSATLAPRPAQAADPGADGRPSLRWVERSGQTVVEVVGLDDASLDALRRLGPGSRQWTAILPVRVNRPEGEPVSGPIYGRYDVADGILRFTPRYPLLAGAHYIARFQRLSMTTQEHAEPAIESTYTMPQGPAGPPGRVVAIYPSADLLPENVLKLYLHFSVPMARGEAYRRVHLRDFAGRPVERPFLEIGEELWDPQGRRLTLLFDPGRIKRGLVPREEEGPILEEGKAYVLTVDRDWSDADGRPLAADFRKSFRAGPPDSSQPRPARWSISPVHPGTHERLVARFPEPLDQAMLGRSIGVEVGGRLVAGRAEVGPGEMSWSFAPDAPWPPGPASLRVDTELEDVAGNSVARPFEVDLFRVQPSARTTPRMTVPVPPPSGQ